MTNVNDDIRFSNAFRIRRFHLITVRRTLLDEQFGFTNTVHHLRYQ